MESNRLKSALRHLLSRAVLPVVALSFSLTVHAAEPLKIGYSDWPGWVAWQVAIEKGWFKEAGVDVEFEWFDYVPSMDAFSAGKVDAVCMTNGDDRKEICDRLTIAIERHEPRLAQVRAHLLMSDNGVVNCLSFAISALLRVPAAGEDRVTFDVTLEQSSLHYSIR